jgi:hypothetical protein
MTAALTDILEIEGTKLPRLAKREELESLGARHLKTDNFKIDEIERTIEYMIIEKGYIAVWKKLSTNEDYELHLFAPKIVKFS